MSGVPQKGEARPHSLAKKEITRTKSDHRTLPLTLSLTLPLALPLALPPALSLTVPPLLQKPLARHKINLQSNPIRIFKQNRVVAWGPHGLFGAVDDLGA